MFLKVKSNVGNYPEGLICDPALLGGNYLADLFRGFGVNSLVVSEGEKSELITAITSSMRGFYLVSSIFVLLWMILFFPSIVPKFVNSNGLSWMAPLVLFAALPTCLIHLQHRILLKRMVVEEYPRTKTD